MVTEEHQQLAPPNQPTAVAPNFIKGVVNLRGVIVPIVDMFVPAGHIIGLGIVKQDGQERMLILVDIEQPMTGADMALVDAPLK